MKWEVGKWYKQEQTDYTRYIKFEWVVNKGYYNQIHFSEYIVIDNKLYTYCNEPDYWANTDMEKQALKNGPIDIEEIRQYLPMDHPDLEVISKETNYNYLIPFLKALK